MDFLIEAGKQIVLSAIGALVFALCAWAFFRSWIFRKAKNRVEHSFEWYAIVLFTVEYRLRRLDQEFTLYRSRRGEHDANQDSKLASQLHKAQADLAALQTAAEALLSAVDLPFDLQLRLVPVAKFGASHARLVSELQRAVAVVADQLDRGILGQDPRYVAFLLGGRSPVFQGRSAPKKPPRDDQVRKDFYEKSDLRQLINANLTDFRDLARIYLELNDDEVKTRFRGEAYWPDDWDGWKPTLQASTAQSSGGEETRPCRWACWPRAARRNRGEADASPK